MGVFSDNVLFMSGVSPSDSTPTTYKKGDFFDEKYNDISLVYDPAIHNELINNGMIKMFHFWVFFCKVLIHFFRGG
jgi:hypothetical protein